MMRVWDLNRCKIGDLVNKIEECIPESCLFDKERFIAACNEGDTLNEIVKPIVELYKSIDVHFECTAEELYALYDRWWFYVR